MDSTPKNDTKTKNALDLLIKTREKFLKISDNKTSPKISKSSEEIKLNFSEFLGKVGHDSISAGVQYKAGGLGNKKNINLTELHEEIINRKNNQVEREMEIMCIFASDLSKEENAETEEAKKTKRGDQEPDLPTSPEEEMDKEEEPKLFCCLKHCQIF